MLPLERDHIETFARLALLFQFPVQLVASGLVVQSQEDVLDGAMFFAVDFESRILEQVTSPNDAIYI